jgi:hypothetical protein
MAKVFSPLVRKKWLSFYFPDAQKAGNNSNRKSHQINDGGEPIAPRGSLDMSHFYSHRADGKGLAAHLELAG